MTTTQERVDTRVPGIVLVAGSILAMVAMSHPPAPQLVQDVVLADLAARRRDHRAPPRGTTAGLLTIWKRALAR